MMMEEFVMASAEIEKDWRKRKKPKEKMMLEKMMKTGKMNPKVKQLMRRRHVTRNVNDVAEHYEDSNLHNQ